MITQAYKDFEVLVTFGEGDGIVIRRVVKGKYYVLHRVNYVFIKPDDGIKRGCDYIDNFPEKLADKFKQMFIDFCEKVQHNPGNYANTKIDITYYLRCYKQLQSKGEIKTKCQNFKPGKSHYGNRVSKRCKSVGVNLVNGKMYCINCTPKNK